MTQDQTIAVVTGSIAVAVAGAIAVGVSLPGPTFPQPTPIEAALTRPVPSEAREVRMEDMPTSGQSELDSSPIQPGDEAEVMAQLPAEWAWGGHITATSTGFEFTPSVVQHDDATWIVVHIKNTGDSPARFDAFFDYVPSSK